MPQDGRNESTTTNDSMTVFMTAMAVYGYDYMCCGGMPPRQPHHGYYGIRVDYDARLEEQDRVNTNTRVEMYRARRASPGEVVSSTECATMTASVAMVRWHDVRAILGWDESSDGRVPTLSITHEPKESIPHLGICTFTLVEDVQRTMTTYRVTDSMY